MNEVRRTIYIDCTATYFVRLNTGIQRVVRNIVSRASDRDDDAPPDCVPVVSFGGHFWTSKSFASLSPSSKAVTTLRNRMSKTVSRLDSREKDVLQMSARARPYGALAGLISTIRRAIVSAGYAFFQMRFLGPLLLGRVRKVAPARGDILLMPDAFWDYDIISPLARPRYQSLTVIPVIHDLISITHPEFCVDDYCRRFEDLLPRLLRVSSGVIAISHATRDELIRYLERTGLAEERKLPIGVWYSGADPVDEARQESGGQPIRAEISAGYSRHDTFLMVGTIEPRKGHDIVFEAMSSLWQQGSTDHLVIVGRVGWLCDALLARMQASPFFGKYLHLYVDANDAELGHLYRNSMALIFASQAEGFGLPMVEAMQNGLAVIASDIPIFREIGDGYATFFRPADAADLTRAIASVKNRPQPGKRGQDARWHTWDNATRRLIDLAQTPDLGDREARG